MKDIKGKIAIVTGAGRGIGLVAVTELLKEGLNVFATSRNILKLQDIDNDRLMSLSADLTDENSFEQIVSECKKAFGGIDIIINNAGYIKKDLLCDTISNDWDRHMAVNVRAPFLLVNAAMPHLLESNHATILNICSVVATKGYEGQGSYVASKHALLGYTKVLARETFEQGIRVHAISPGGVATDLIKEARPDLDMSMLSTPQEIVDIMIFLIKNRGGAVMDEINVRRYTKEPFA